MKEKKGIKSTRIFIPTVFFFALIHSVIILISIMISITSSEMNVKNQESSECINTVSSILSHSSKLADTSTTFIYTPEIPTGPSSTKLNEEPLLTYFEELTDDDRNLDKITESLNSYEMDSEAKQHVDTAIEKLGSVIKQQAHALHLINNSVIQLPSHIIDGIEPYELTSEELSYSKERAKQEAIKLMFDKDYSWKKRDVANEVNIASTLIITSTSIEQKNADKKLDGLRALLWIFNIIIVVIDFLFFVMLFRILVLPINNFSVKINNNEKIGYIGGVYEVNLLSHSYDNLMDKHEELEKELRFTAERDSLTGLKNRYSYNEFLKRETKKGLSVCAFLFDINKLKETNDTYGHSTGDELIKKASLCISECFNEKNCYRIGGDEFVAIIENEKREIIDELINCLIQKQKENNVSMAIGYSYTEDISSIGYEKLINEADEMMYKNKKIMENKQ